MVKRHISMYNDTLINTIVKFEGFNKKLINIFVRKKPPPLKEIASWIYPMYKYNVRIRDMFCGL